MSRDQGAARSEPYTELARCADAECGHLSSWHAIAESGARSGCSASTCRCRRFVAEAVAS